VIELSQWCRNPNDRLIAKRDPSPPHGHKKKDPAEPVRIIRQAAASTPMSLARARYRLPHNSSWTLFAIGGDRPKGEGK
jgi:hypothetical protein